jgi:hypothetical protein
MEYEEMSWHSGLKVWRRMFKGKRYSISPRQLIKRGFPVESATRDGSRQAANLYWQSIEKQTLAPVPPVLAELANRLAYAKVKGLKNMVQNIKEVMRFATMDESIHPDTYYVLDQLKILQEIFDRSGLKIVNQSGQEVDVRSLDASVEELSTLFNIKRLWKERVARVASTSRTIGTMVDKFLDFKKSQIGYGIMDVYPLHKFRDFLGASNSASSINEETWDIYKRHANREEQHIAISFIRYCYMLYWLDALPQNLND